jgi:hypothetical protein
MAKSGKSDFAWGKVREGGRAVDSEDPTTTPLATASRSVSAQEAEAEPAAAASSTKGQVVLAFASCVCGTCELILLP